MLNYWECGWFSFAHIALESRSWRTPIHTQLSKAKRRQPPLRGPCKKRPPSASALPANPTPSKLSKSICQPAAMGPHHPEEHQRQPRRAHPRPEGPPVVPLRPGPRSKSICLAAEAARPHPAELRFLGRRQPQRPFPEPSLHRPQLRAGHRYPLILMPRCRFLRQPLVWPRHPCRVRLLHRPRVWPRLPCRALRPLRPRVPLRLILMPRWRLMSLWQERLLRVVPPFREPRHPLRPRRIHMPRWLVKELRVHWPVQRRHPRAEHRLRLLLRRLRDRTR